MVCGLSLSIVLLWGRGCLAVKIKRKKILLTLLSQAQITIYLVGYHFKKIIKIKIGAIEPY